MMAIRAVNSCSLFPVASSLPLSAFRCRLFSVRTLHFRPHSNFEYFFEVFPYPQQLVSNGGVRSYSILSIVEGVVALRKRKRVCATSRLGLTSKGELEDKLVNRSLEK